MANNCPNSDPEFDKVLRKIISKFTNNDDYNSMRKYIYYGVCVWVRFFLYLLVFLLRENKIMQIIVLILSFAATINLTYQYFTLGAGLQWWSKRFILFMAFLIFSSSVFTLFKQINSLWTPMLLFFSLAFGIFQSLNVDFC
jgi:hypothetical protein